MGSLGTVVMTEQLARVDMGNCTSIITACFGCEAIFAYGSEEQKKTYIPSVCRGEKISAGAYTEPDAGTDVAGYRTRAIKDGKDYIITGNKMFITNGSICDFLVTQCLTHPDEKRHNRFSMIIVPADAPGLTRNKIHGKLGIRASNTAEVSYEEVAGPPGESGRRRRPGLLSVDALL